MELWCWLWAGTAERELRIWKELRSSRDIRKEKRACLELRELLLSSIEVPPDDGMETLAHVRLSNEMAGDAANAFETRLRELARQAKARASGIEVGGNDSDAMMLVLGGFLPVVSRLRTSPRPPDTAPPGALGPVQAFRFHAWLASTIELLEDGAANEAFDGRERWKEALPAMRMVLGQWIASLPPDRGATHYFHTTWDRLEQGVDADALRSFASWLAWRARASSSEPAGARENLDRTVALLARESGLSREELRSAPDPTPPWTPPDPLPRPYLGGQSGPNDPFDATIVDNTRVSDRAGMPLHQFVASLDRGGAAPAAPASPPSAPAPAQTVPSGFRLARVTHFGQEIWSEGEPFPMGEELFRRLLLADRGEADPSTARSTAREKPLPPKPTPHMDPPPPRHLVPRRCEDFDVELPISQPRVQPGPATPEVPAKEPDFSERFILARPRLQVALAVIMTVGILGGMAGMALLFLLYIGMNLDVPYLGEFVFALNVSGYLAYFCIPKSVSESWSKRDARP